MKWNTTTKRKPRCLKPPSSLRRTDVDLSDMVEYTYAEHLTFLVVTELEVERAIKGCRRGMSTEHALNGLLEQV